MMNFRINALAELTAQQMRFAPPAKRREQLANASKLLAEIEPGKAYPYQFVGFRLTEYRSDLHADLLISGEDLKHDLALFIIQIERSLPPLPKLRHPPLACEKLGDEGRQGPRAGAGRMGALIRQQDEGPSRMALSRLMQCVRFHDA